ncbi:NADP-dependent oxidoreductase [Thalassotalea sp. Y01]|uniref:NADP-dependent oxidoreductase n=1 Tax=Thalassotalea sp. Y01 TaxID=2729613 RepID=UPI00145CBC08|nr:NADP-dependent oxidoreductase [Thalassotalea sp. Y01]NMP15469.1 NADP-dependent oxidoreductase [Thalassotalea sp. Y01]
MTQIINKAIVMSTRPVGMPKLADFCLQSHNIDSDDLTDGQVLIKNHYLSLDPYMRGRMSLKKSYAEPLQEGEIITGEAVGEVIASKSDKYHIGTFVCSMSGWQTHFVSHQRSSALYPVFNDQIALSAYLGVIGMPGRTAYLGFKHKAKPQPGETIVVSAASGAVGSVVGQLAKQHGLRVIGVTGSAQKCQYVKQQLGFDECLNYQADDFEQALTTTCANGIDIYWEGVGGRTLNAVAPLLNEGARVPICGFISNYNDTSVAAETPFQVLAKLKPTPEHGFFLVSDWLDEYPTATMALAQGVIDGSLKFKESTAHGIANAPQAFIGMLSGKNFGKQIVKLV